MARKKSSGRDLTEIRPLVEGTVPVVEVESFPAVIEEVPAVEVIPEVEVPKEMPVSPKVDPPKEEDLPKAVATAVYEGEVSAVALKTCVKFISGWRHLVEGKSITAPAGVVQVLRRSGLVK